MFDKFFLSIIFSSLSYMAAGAHLSTSLSIEKDAEKISFGTIASDSSRIFNLDEVVVVSQPKETALLRQQPLSSSVFTIEGLSRLGIRDLRDLSTYVPSFVMPDYGSRYTSSMYIRGIGSRVNSPAVGIYYDGMPIMSKSAYNTHIYQLDRIDILRGPQGTLYGQNTEGGLIKMYSRNPLNYQGTDIKIGIGSYFYRNAEISHNQKMNEQLAFSLAGFYNGQNGFFFNRTTNERADQYNEAGGRCHLYYNPTKHWSVNLLADYQYVRQNGFPYGVFTPQSQEWESPSTDRQGNYRRNIFHTALGMTFKGKGVDITSTTSYQYLKDYMLMDIDYLPEDYMYMEQRQFQNALTQEITLKSKPLHPWQWVLGAFFSQQWLKTKAPVYFGKAMNGFLSQTISDYAYDGMFNAMVRRMVEAGMPQAAAEQQVARTIENAGGVHIDMSLSPIPGTFRTPQTNVGLFHESNFRMSHRLTAIVGLRYDYSHSAIDYASLAQMKIDESVMGTQVKATALSELAHQEHADFNQLLPKIGLTWQIDKRKSNIYATWSKGYRTGGFNIQMFSDILQTELQEKAQSIRGDVVIEHDETTYQNIAHTISYAPETSWNYEIGTHLNIFENRVHLDIATFYMLVHNLQLSVMADKYGFGRMMVNAGRSHSSGGEMSLRGSSLNNHLSWAASLAYTHAVFASYMDGEKDYSGNHVPFVPLYTFAAQAEYRWDFSRAVLRSLTLGASVHGQGKNYWDEANTCAQKAYVLTDAHVQADCGRISINVWGRNITNTTYHTFAVSSTATGKQNWFAQRGNPFQFGMDLNIHL